MNNNLFNIIWTAIWLIFMFALCFIFKSGSPLWLLIIWVLGYEY